MKVKWCERALRLLPHYGLCLSPEAFVREMDRLQVSRKGRPAFLKNERANACTHFFTYQGKVCCIVTIDPDEAFKQRPIEVAGLLVHESTHIWQEYCGMVGETNPGSEQEAYAIQWISQQLMAEWVRWLKRRKKK